MMPLDRIKELVGDPSPSDEEAEEIRDACYAFAELAIQTAKARRKETSSSGPPNNNSAPKRA